MKMYCG